ncbi:hypothetical protein CC80DRAFT_508032 [Byssothecium circinans]|uniref:Major facilitator superfamily (MFS) profile domain-containing protein n=1 Tax=Byssothecium circinans TaxID=147558 RepID=A0A6A5TK66_9PLEO|nr:hypothetical protein CC80DRAFT_508032 [Byssothecium circinans]
MAARWFCSPQQIGRYFLTRLSSLPPPRNSHVENPIRILKQPNRHQGLMFWCGFLGWAWDAFDFFAVSLTVTEIAKDLDVHNYDVSWEEVAFIINLSALIALELGLFGPATSTAPKDLPYEARGSLSRLFEQGYATGYLTTSHGWRSLFWFSAGPPVLIIALRLCLPETNHFLVGEGGWRGRMGWQRGREGEGECW